MKKQIENLGEHELDAFVAIFEGTDSFFIEGDSIQSMVIAFPSWSRFYESTVGKVTCLSMLGLAQQGKFEIAISSDDAQRSVLEFAFETESPFDSMSHTGAPIECGCTWNGA